MAIEYLPSGSDEVVPGSGGWTTVSPTDKDTHDICPWKAAIFTDEDQQPGSDIEDPLEELG